MKRMVVAASDDLPEIPTLDEYLNEVAPEDIDLIRQLMTIKTFNGKLFSAPSRRNQLGKTPNYSKEDKVIHLVKREADYRVYEIPYTGYKFRGIIGIFTFPLTCYDDGSFRFGDGKVRNIDSVSDSTLSSDVSKARNSFF